MDLLRKQHWETVYETKTPEQVSWTQAKPETSLQLIQALKLPKSARIIDVGGGDSKLVDYLLEEGFENITVLDISEKALERAKNRLGEKANQVEWVASDITEYKPDKTFDLWHDRAAFHFLTESDQINQYLTTVRSAVAGHLVIGTFSEIGPLKCSGLEIRQYSEKSLGELFQPDFEKITSLNTDHVTPFDTVQNFVFCSFKRKSNFLQVS